MASSRKTRGRRPLRALPDELPVLCREDLAAGRTLRDWLDDCLPPGRYVASAREELASALMVAAWAAYGYYGLPPAFVPAADQAALWNEALRRLGYGVPAHACVVLGRKK